MEYHMIAYQGYVAERSLEHHVIHTVHIELNICPDIAMPQGELGLLHVRWLQPNNHKE